MPSPFNCILNRFPQARTLLSNFLSLGFVRATDAAVLLLLIPLIIDRVGIANYGAVAFVQVFLNYGRTVIDYGFNVSGVREVALARDDRSRLSSILADVLATRAVLAAAFAGLLLLAVPLLPPLAERAAVFYWGLVFLFGHVFFTDWLFIGKQDAGYLAVANLAARLLFAAFIWWGVTEPADYVYVLAWQGAAGAIVAGPMLFFIVKKYRLSLRIPDPAGILHYLRSDFRLLLTHFIIEFNATFSIVVLGLFTNDTLTGQFNVMYKLVQAVRFLLVIFSQTIFPTVCARTREGWDSVRAFLRRTYRPFFPVAVAAVLFLVAFAGPLLRFFAGGADAFLIASFRAYALLPVIVLLNIPAYQLLLAYERKSAYTRVYLVSILLKTGLEIAAVLAFGLPGLIAAVLVVELFVTLGLHWMVRRHLPPAPQTGAYG